MEREAVAERVHGFGVADQLQGDESHRGRDVVVRHRIGVAFDGRDDQLIDRRDARQGLGDGLGHGEIDRQPDRSQSDRLGGGVGTLLGTTGEVHGHSLGGKGLDDFFA